MFEPFEENGVWAASDTTVTIADSTDTSIDGSSTKIVWEETDEGEAVLSFDEIDLAEWEEFSFQIYTAGTLSDENLFKVVIDGADFNFSRADYVASVWNHIVIDCSSMGRIQEIKIVSLVSDLTLFVDCIGVRKVTYNCDVDIIEALKNHISLDYDAETVLSEDVSAGDTSVSLDSFAYINDSSMIEIDNGAGVTETVQLLNRDGDLAEALENDFSAGDTVRVVCPIRSEEDDSLEPDPICGVKVFDISTDREETTVFLQNGTKIKEYLGSLGVIVYIDCSSKKKLLQMVREFNRNYGKEFQFVLDGETVDIYLENSLFADSLIGNNPRQAYYYRVQPQPYLLSSYVESVSNTLNMESKPI